MTPSGSGLRPAANPNDNAERKNSFISGEMTISNIDDRIALVSTDAEFSRLGFDLSHNAAPRVLHAAIAYQRWIITAVAQGSVIRIPLETAAGCRKL